MDNKEIIEATQPWDTDQELTREEKSVVFCIKTLNDLIEEGLVTGGKYKVTEKGLKEIEDFKPTDEDIEFGMAILAREGLIGCRDDVTDE